MTLPVYYHKLTGFKNNYINLDNNLYSLLEYAETTFEHNATVQQLTSMQDQLNASTNQGSYKVVIVTLKDDNTYQKIKKPTNKHINQALNADDKSVVLLAIYTPYDPYISVFW